MLEQAGPSRAISHFIIAVEVSSRIEKKRKRKRKKENEILF